MEGNASYIPIKTKTITCVDCGKEVVVDARDMKTKRCEDCRAIYNRNYQKELMRKRRNK